MQSKRGVCHAARGKFKQLAIGATRPAVSPLSPLILRQLAAGGAEFPGRDATELVYGLRGVAIMRKLKAVRNPEIMYRDTHLSKKELFHE